MTSKITLQCVKEKSKLRIKFYSFTDAEGKVYTNVYNNTLNCKFPKDIRKEGFFYEIGPNDLNLATNGDSKPFYQITTKNIKVLPVIDLTSITVYEITECVVCLSADSTHIMIPCGHRCMCVDCSSQISKMRNRCPICRRDVLQVLDNLTIG
jgi:hypothetical protein